MTGNEEIKVTIEIGGVEHVSTPDTSMLFRCIDCSIYEKCVLNHSRLRGACLWLKGLHHFELKNK